MNRNAIRAAVAALGLFLGTGAVAAPSAPLDAYEPAAFFQLAHQRLAVKDVDAAEYVLREGMRAHPAEPGFHASLGQVFEARGRKAEAFYEYQWELLRTGIEDPIGDAAARRAAMLTGDAEVREVLSALHAMRADPSGSRRRLAKIRGERGSRLVLDLWIAEAARLAGDPGASEKGYRAVIAQDPSFIPAYVGLASLLARTGKTAEAAELTSTAAHLSPQHWSLVAAGGAK